MKLIHCADFHLESPLAQLSPDKAELRRNELLQTFGRLVSYATEQAVDAVLIAGDWFDASIVTRKTVDYIRSVIDGCPADFYYLRGNHDGTFSFPDPPERLHFFGSEWRSYRCGTVTISGIEPADGSWTDAMQLDPAACNVVMLHGGLDGHDRDGILPEPLRKQSIDYLALGHWHTHRMDALDARGTWAYAGCPEPRGFDECGTKGFVLLDVQNGGIRPTFIPFAQRTYHAVRVDLSGCAEPTRQQEAVRAAIDGIPHTDGVQLTLTGRCKPEAVLEDAFWIAALQERFFQFRLENRIHPALDTAQLRSEISLRGAFYRRVMQSGFTAQAREEILKLGFAALDGTSIFSGENDADTGSLY